MFLHRDNQTPNFGFLVAHDSDAPLPLVCHQNR